MPCISACDGFVLARQLASSVEELPVNIKRRPCMTYNKCSMCDIVVLLTLTITGDLNSPICWVVLGTIGEEEGRKVFCDDLDSAALHVFHV